MKNIFKSLLFPLGVSVFFGFICGKIVYSVYNEDIENKLSSSKLYLVLNGEYLTYDLMREENNGNNYIYYKDDDGYKSVIGITNDIDNVEKIKKLYSDNLKVEEYYISSDLFNDKQLEYDNKLKNTDNIYEVRDVVDNILNLYREDETIKLVLAK